MIESTRLIGRRVLVAKFTLCLVLCLGLLALRFLWLEPAGAIPLQDALGYGIVLLSFVCWCFLGWRLGIARGWWTRARLLENREVLLWALGGAVFLQLHEPHLPKVLFDEATHPAMSLVMHFEKKAMMPGVSHYIGDRFVVGNFYPSFRAYLFPLLGSLISDITGYRPENLLILNALLAFGILMLAGIVGRRLGGRIGGVVAIGMLLGLPLLAQNATSYGYDLLNLFMLAVLTYVAVVLPTVAESAQRRLFLSFGTATAVLLAVCRYESILYLFPWALIVALQWKRWRAVVLPWFAVLAPAFLLPCFLSNLLMLGKGVDAYVGQFDSKVGFFSISYLPDHLSQALYYFATLRRDGTSSLLLFGAGLIGFLFMVVRRTRGTERTREGLLILAVATGLIYVGILTQFWSSPLDSLAARFTLPLWLLLALAAAWFVGQIPWLTRNRGWGIVALVAWAVVVGVPVSARAFATHAMPPSRVEAVELEYARARPRTRTLYVNFSNNLMIAHRYACQSIDRLNETPAAFVRVLKAGLYDEVVIIQRIDIDPVSPKGKPMARQELRSEIVTELIEERLIEFSHAARVSRLVGFRKADGVLVTRESDDESVRLRTDFKNATDFGSYRLSLYP